MTRISRRALLSLLSGSALARALPAAAAPRPDDGLVRLLQLTASEAAWLRDLTSKERGELAAGLQARGPVAAHTLHLAQKLLSRRSHLFPYLGYPQVEDKRSVCDGLVRE